MKKRHVVMTIIAGASLALTGLSSNATSNANDSEAVYNTQNSDSKFAAVYQFLAQQNFTEANTKLNSMLTSDAELSSTEKFDLHLYLAITYSKMEARYIDVKNNIDTAQTYLNDVTPAKQSELLSFAYKVSLAEKSWENALNYLEQYKQISNEEKTSEEKYLEAVANFKLARYERASEGLQSLVALAEAKNETPGSNLMNLLVASYIKNLQFEQALDAANLRDTLYPEDADATLMQYLQSKNKQS